MAQFTKYDRWEFPSNKRGYEHFRGWADLLSTIDSAIGSFRIGSIGDVGHLTREYAHTILTIDPQDFSRLENVIGNYMHVPRKSKAMLREIGEYIVGEVVPRIYSDRDTNGQWQALSEVTNMWRNKRGFPREHPILINTGELLGKASSTEAIVDIKTGESGRVVLGGDKFSGNIRDKFFVHMAGSNTGGWGNMIHIPARPFMPKDESDFTRSEKDKIRDIMDKHIDDMAKRKRAF